MTHHVPRSALRLLLITSTIIASSQLGGCASKLPCLQYQPQTFTRTVTMRGHGSMMVTEEAMVCTRRGSLDSEDLLSN